MITPSDLDGAAPPPGAPAYFLRHNDDEVHNSGSNDPGNDFLEIFELSVDFANAANSSFTGPFQVAIADIDSDLTPRYRVPGPPVSGAPVSGARHH